MSTLTKRQGSTGVRALIAEYEPQNSGRHSLVLCHLHHEDKRWYTPVVVDIRRPNVENRTKPDRKKKSFHEIKPLL